MQHAPGGRTEAGAFIRTIPTDPQNLSGGHQERDKLTPAGWNFSIDHKFIHFLAVSAQAQRGKDIAGAAGAQDGLGANNIGIQVCFPAVSLIQLVELNLIRL